MRNLNVVKTGKQALEGRKFTPKLRKIMKEVPLVNEMVILGRSQIDIIEAMAVKMKILEKIYSDLFLIAPFKVKDGDGNMIIWRCPDRDVPLRESPKPNQTNKLDPEVKKRIPC